MTSKQNSLYWKEWSLAKKAGQLNEFDRHAIHEEALGEDKSHKEFTNEDLDKVLGAFRAISRPSSLNSQVRQIEMPETRLMVRIAHQKQCLSLFVDHPDNYFAAILRNRFHKDTLEQILLSAFSLDTLKQLRNTLGDRIAKFRREAGITEHDMCVRAGVPCFRKDCAVCRDIRKATQSRPTPEAVEANPF